MGHHCVYAHALFPLQARRDQQIEVEKFVDREYSRQDETPQPWPVSKLATAPGSDDHPFYRLADFRLRHGEPLQTPDYLYLSTNYFNPKWTGLRRLKNVVMLLEWAPDASTDALRLYTPDERLATAAALGSEEQAALAKAHSLLAFEASGRAGTLAQHLSQSDLSSTVKAAADYTPSDAELAALFAAYSDAPDGVTLNGLRRLLQGGQLTPVCKGRYWVAVSLAEAETLRRILHLRQQRPLLDGKTTEVALRYSPVNMVGSIKAPDGGKTFDTTNGWCAGTGLTPYEARLSHSVFKFFDGDMHFTDEALHVLLRALQRSSTRDRKRFFGATIGCRRRMVQQWQSTPLAKVFILQDEWRLLKQRAQSVFIRQALKKRQLTLWEAFKAFDSDDNGLLSPEEIYGALRWVGMSGLTEDDVVDFIEAADQNQDGMVDWNEYAPFFCQLHALGSVLQAPVASAGTWPC